MTRYDNIYQPGTLYNSCERDEIIGETGIEGAPDLVVEVLSPATAYYDLRTKFRAYEKSGVKEYWIVDPERKSVEVYTVTNGKFSLSSEAEGTGTTQSFVLSEFSANIALIFP